MFNTIDILKCSAGDPHGMHATPDPYWKQPGGWPAHAPSDGMSYGGVMVTLHRLPGESDAEFEKRAEATADKLESTI